jgi:hypothetical protein
MKYYHSLEITVDMLAYAIDNPAPSTIVLISGDRDFAYALSILRLRRYQVVLITLPTAHPSLTSQASIRFDWLNDILLGTNGSESHLERSRAALFRERPWEISPVPPLRPNMDFDGHNEESSCLVQSSPKKGHPKPPSVSSISAPTGLESIRNPQIHVGVSSQNHQPPNYNSTYSHPVPQNTKFQSPPTNTSVNDVGHAVGTPDTRNPQLSAEDFVFPEEFSTPLTSPSMRSASAPSLFPSPPLITEALVSTLTTPVNHPLRPISATPIATVRTTIAEQVLPDGGSTTIPSSSVPSVPPMFTILVDILQARRLKGDHQPLRCVVADELSKKVVFKTAAIKKFSQYVAPAVQIGIVELGGEFGRDWIALKPPFHNVST